MPEPEMEEEKKDDGRHKVFFDISHGKIVFVYFAWYNVAHYRTYLDFLDTTSSLCMVLSVYCNVLRRSFVSSVRHRWG